MFRITIVSDDAALTDTVQPDLEAAGLEVVRLRAFHEETEPDPAAAPDVLCLDLRDTATPARSPFQDRWRNAFVLCG